MTVKPISFNAEMVRAILDRKKTCTRRLVEPQPDEKHAYPLGFVIHSTEKKDVGCFGFGIDEYGSSIEHVKPPYQYQPGDILYVQEPWERFECQNCEGYEGGNCPNEPQTSTPDKTRGCYMYQATDSINAWNRRVNNETD